MFSLTFDANIGARSVIEILVGVATAVSLVSGILDALAATVVTLAVKFVSSAAATGKAVARRNKKCRLMML